MNGLFPLAECLLWPKRPCSASFRTFLRPYAPSCAPRLSLPPIDTTFATDTTGHRPKPFIQAISDVSPPLSSLVFEEGHVLFVGDSVLGPRPHTAASTNQAALHALTLFYLLRPSSELAAVQATTSSEERRAGFVALESLLREGYERKASQYSRMLYGSGKEMGDRSQFGTHPFSVDKPVEVGPARSQRPPHGRTLSGVAL